MLQCDLHSCEPLPVNSCNYAQIVLYLSSTIQFQQYGIMGSKRIQVVEHVGIVMSLLCDSVEIEIVPILETYANAQDRDKFAAFVDEIDWYGHTPDEILRVVDLALSLDMVDIARKLAQKAAQLHPSHKQSQRAAHVLNPPAGRIVHIARPPGLDKSQEWLSKYAHTYRGKWVALHNGVLVGFAQTLKELKNIVCQKYALDSLLITKSY